MLALTSLPARSPSLSAAHKINLFTPRSMPRAVESSSAHGLAQLDPQSLRGGGGSRLRTGARQEGALNALEVGRARQRGFKPLLPAEKLKNVLWPALNHTMSPYCPSCGLESEPTGPGNVTLRARAFQDYHAKSYYDQ